MDMRENIDILFAVVRFQMSLNPYMKDSVFIFMSKNLHIMKLLYRDRCRFELIKIRLINLTVFVLK